MTRRDVLYTLFALPIGYIVSPFVSIFVPHKHLKKIGQFLSRSDKIINSDAAVVLGGGSIHRVRFGASLYNRGFIKKLIVYRNIRTRRFMVGVSRSTVVEAKRLGVRSRDLIHEDKSETTIDEANNLKRILPRIGYRSIIVVTDGYHIRRARMIFNEVFRGSSVRILFHSSGAVTFDPSRWWEKSASTSNLISEYFSIGFLYLTRMIASFLSV